MTPKVLFPTSQKKHRFSIKMIILVMIYRKMVTLVESHTKFTNTLCAVTVELVNVKASDKVQ
jgi:hypothetical protein